jgi:hypothetical protein
MEKSEAKNNSLPDNFVSIIQDFTKDLTNTFPEYSYLWSKWYDSTTQESEYVDIYNYCLTIYPERFFDIIYQNDDIFSENSSISTLFLPCVEFKVLFNCEGISENTKKSLWKYLQLIMVTIMSGVHDKTIFGDTAHLFNGINEDDLHNKLSETIEGLSEFFKNSLHSREAETNIDGEPNMNDFKNVFENIGKSMDEEDHFGKNIPNSDELNEHLKNLFDGKIGTLAKELAEDLSEDIMNMFREQGEDVSSTQDVLKKIMKNPKKMMDLMKTVGTKLDAKMKNGDISQEDLMKEAGEIMGKMKGMGGSKDFQEMMKKMAKNMAGMAGTVGKNAKFDMNALSRMSKVESSKDRMRSKLLAKQTLQSQPQCVLEATQNPNNLVFKIEGEDSQPKTSVPINDDWLNESSKPASSSKTSSSKKKKGKTKK